VRGTPGDIRPEVVAAAITAEWDIYLDEVNYHPEGGGAYHWIARANGGPAHFVTVDDLDTKPWLGADRATAFEGLSAAYALAIELRRSRKLGFVVAPLPSVSGAPCVRFGARYALALFPFVRGVPGHWGQPLDSFDRAELVALLADLHRTVRPTDSVPRRFEGLPGRTHLDQALDEVDQPWEGGPLSEPARAELRRAAPLVADWLSELDSLTETLAATDQQPVVTHGEPHPGNLIRADEGVVLVDWDTVTLGPPERDLWMFDDDTWARYERLTGRQVDLDMVRMCTLVWALADVASFVEQLRASHTESVDDKRALVALQRQLHVEEPAPYGTPLL
jgi:spectinomycin phosphotransferase